MVIPTPGGCQEKKLRRGGMWGVPAWPAAAPQGMSRTCLSLFGAEAENGFRAADSPRAQEGPGSVFLLPRRQSDLLWGPARWSVVSGPRLPSWCLLGWAGRPPPPLLVLPSLRVLCSFFTASIRGRRHRVFPAGTEQALEVGEGGRAGW